MRHKDDNLRSTLLSIARQITDTEGIAAVNIRLIARRAGVATGTVYNYFSNKDEILLALTEEYWKDTLPVMWESITSESFCGQLEEIFLFLQDRIQNSAGLLMQSLENVENAGHERMAIMQRVMEKEMIRRMELDHQIRADLWDTDFTMEKYSRFIMMNIMMLLRADLTDINFFMQIVRRTIYQNN